MQDAVDAADTVNIGGGDNVFSGHSGHSGCSKYWWWGHCL